MAAGNRPLPITIFLILEWLALAAAGIAFFVNLDEATWPGISLFAGYFGVSAVSSVGLWLNRRWGGILSLVPLGTGIVLLLINALVWPAVLLLLFMALIIVHLEKMDVSPPRGKKGVNMSAVWQCPDCGMYNLHTLVCQECGRVRDLN